MKLIQEERELQTNIEGKDIDFKISNNAVMFNILRSKMYEDPIGAVCREICSNARDANRENKLPDKPIEICLPGEYYVIKDYGIGISPDRIENIYTWYGESTKRDSNDETGGYGLGAKTPFSITDQFSIQTIHDGIEYQYAAFLDKSGVGKIKEVSKKETNDPSGTIIKIPVKRDNIQEFTDKTLFYTTHWKPIPKYLGINKVIVPNILLEGSCWKIYEEDVSFNCLYDDIPYYYGKKIKTYSWQQHHNYSSSIPKSVVLIFNTGEIEVAATREKITQSDFNERVIKNKINLFKEEYTDIVTKTIAQKDNFIDVLNILNSDNLLNSNEFEWKGYKFNYPPTKGVFQYYSRKYGRKLTSSNIVETDIPIIIRDCEFTRYRKGNVNRYLEEQSFNKCNLLDPHILPPIEDSLYLSNLRIPKETKTRAKNNPNIRVMYLSGSAYKNYTHISKDTSEETIYTYDGVMQWYLFPMRVYEITAKIKRPSLGKNWIKVKDFLEREVHNKFSIKQLEDYFVAIRFKLAYPRFIKFIPEFNNFNQLNTQSQNLIQWCYSHDIFLKIDKGKIETKYDEIINKYKLISILNSYVPVNSEELYQSYFNKGKIYA